MQLLILLFLPALFEISKPTAVVYPSPSDGFDHAEHQDCHLSHHKLHLHEVPKSAVEPTISGSSAAKTASNRNNASKSTGPKSARGKAASKLNALKFGIFASTPLLPGEDESAYHLMEKSYRDHFSPVGPVENMLVRQLAVEEWKLGRLDRAAAALQKELVQTQLQRLFRSLPDDSRKSFISLLAKFDDAVVTARLCPDHVITTAAGEVRDIESQVERVIRGDSAILEALVPASEGAPQQCLDRERRSGLRAYLGYVSALLELQDRRRMVMPPHLPMTT